jgi:hypothetical protein
MLMQMFRMLERLVSFHPNRLLRKFPNYGRKKFYNNGPGSHCVMPTDRNNDFPTCSNEMLLALIRFSSVFDYFRGARIGLEK